MKYEVYMLYDDGTSTLFEAFDTFEAAEEGGLRFQDEYREVFGCDPPMFQIDTVEDE